MLSLHLQPRLSTAALAQVESQPSSAAAHVIHQSQPSGSTPVAFRVSPLHVTLSCCRVMHPSLTVTQIQSQVL